MADQDGKDNARWVVRLYYHPLVTWLFAGGALMAIGGAVSLLDRRRGKKQDGGAT
jgi:cytochrome c-type biogenesis protein CcmF